MKKDIFYRVVIILLLLLNLCTLCYLCMNDRRQAHLVYAGMEKPYRPDDIIINRLELDEQQQQQFFSFRHEHHIEMVEIQKTSSRLHKDLFALLQHSPVDTVAKNNLLKKIQELNMQKEQVTFHHFEQLRSILKAEQTPAFDELVEDLGQRIMGPHREGRP